MLSPCHAFGRWPLWFICAPRWVLKELNSLLFGFFWSGKKDKVNRKVVVQPKDCGGFAVVSIELKVQALLVQWFRRFVISPNSWVSLATYWCFDRFGVDPSAVISSPSTFILSRLPHFYESLFHAWCVVGGSCSSSGIVSICGSGDIRTPVSTVWFHIVFQNFVQFLVIYTGPLPGRICFICPSIVALPTSPGRCVTASYLQWIVLSLLVMTFLPRVFVATPWSRQTICSFTALLRGVVWIGFSPCSFVRRRSPRPLFYVMYFSALHRMNYLLFHVFLSICCMF